MSELKLAFKIGFHKQAGEKYDSCVEQVKEDGKSESEAHAICTDQLDKESYNYIKTKVRE